MNRTRKQELIDIIKRFLSLSDFNTEYLNTFFGMGICIADEIKELEKQAAYFETWLRCNPSFPNAATTVELQVNANRVAVECRLSDIREKLIMCKALKELNENKIDVKKILI